MAGILKSLVDNYQAHLERQRNRPFLDGVMAACALVATADGEVSFAERVRVDQILATLDALKVFDPHEGIDIFNEFTDAILANPAEGHETAFQAMADVAQDAENGALMVRICCAISEANGEKSLADQIEITSICSRLGLDPGNCGIYDPKRIIE
jgi:tellurite resistance protein TerB